MVKGGRVSAALEYRWTIRSCYISNVSTSFLGSSPPIMFTSIMAIYGLSFEQMGRLVAVSFVIQMCTGLFFARLIDKYGVRQFIIGAHFLSCSGMMFYGLTPLLMPGNIYTGLTIAVVVTAIGGGLHELLLSPIINAVPLPEREKAGAMTTLHSFYAWGNVVTILATTGLLFVLGREHWNKIIMAWSLLPLAGAFLFMRVPLAPMVAEEKRTKVVDLIRNRTFMLVICCIILGGAAEITMSSWISAFCDAALNLPKLFGDVAGACMFSLMLGIGRTFYGKFSHKISIYHAMTAGSVLAVLCYLTAAISPSPVLSLIMCGLCGFAVSLLWPGSVVIASARFPLAGASMFALLSAGGDTGGAAGPWIVGLLADIAPSFLQYPGGSTSELGLRAGLLFASLFPLCMVFCVLTLNRNQKNIPKMEVPN